MAMAAKHYSFPVVTGISARDPLSVRAARMHLYQQFINDLDSGGTKVSTQLSEVDISDPEDIWALLPAQGNDIQVHFGDSDFLARYRSYQQHLPEWRQQYPHLASVDMRYQDQVVLDMTKQASGESGQDAPPPPPTNTIQPQASTRQGSLRQNRPKRENQRADTTAMSQKSEDLLTVLDAGSSKVRVLVAELHEGALRYRAHSVVHAEGIRKGLISDLLPASRTFNQAATEAEQLANAVIASCVVGLGGTHVRGVNSQGGISLGNRLREITREDVRAAVDRARSVSLPADREILHLLPQQFILDEQPGIHDPIGMIGNRLEVNLHIATCSASARKASSPAPTKLASR